MNCIKILLATVLISIICTSIYGQKSEKIKVKGVSEEQVVQMSFTDKTNVRSYKEISDGSNVQIIITDVNKLIYKCESIEIQKKYRDESEASPPVILESRTQDLSTFNVVRKSNSLKAEAKNSQDSSQFNINKEKVSNLKSELNKKKQELIQKQELQSILDMANRQSNNLSDTIYLAGELISGNNEIQKRSKSNYKEIQDLGITIQKLSNDLNDAIDELSQMSNIEGITEIKWSEFRKLESALNHVIILHNDLKNELLKTNSQEVVNAKFEKRLTEFFQENVVIDKSLGSYERRLKNSLENIQLSIDTLIDNSFITDVRTVKSVEELSKAISEVTKNLLPDVTKAVKSINEMTLYISNKNNFRCVFTSSLIRSDVDALSMAISINPKDDIKGIGLESFNQTMEFRARGGIKIDFSAGFALNAGFIDNFSILEDDYELSALTDTTSLLKATDNEDILSPSAIGMANFYVRKPGNINFGISVGAGTDLKAVSYYLGGSLLIGREDVLVFTTGVVLAQRRELKSEYRTALNENDGILNTSVGSIDEASLYSDKDPYRMGLFFGFTYNFTANKEKQWKEHFDVSE